MPYRSHIDDMNHVKPLLSMLLARHVIVENNKVIPGVILTINMRESTFCGE